MDPETQRLWNAWCDRRVEVLLAAERERFEARLQALQIEILNTVSEAFVTNSDAVAKFVERAITENAAQGKKLLVEFNDQVQATLSRRLDEPAPRADKTIN
jgi:hypothetical protein